MKTEDRILEAAAELFFRHGIKSITMDAIASHLGMSKRTIYDSYADKHSLVKALTKLEMANQEKELHDIRKQSENPVDELMRAMGCVGRTFSRINPTVFYDLQKFHSESWKYFREFKEQKMQVFIEENLKHGIRLGLYRKDLNVKILAKFRIEHVEMGFNPAIFPHSKFNLTEVQLVSLDHFLHGIVTLKGHKLINKYKQVIEEE
ncbi:MAG: TetR/AcrR family transcriptional regulator [Bacteroidetes bacterium]|nr:TetR/AcrR family transcriptional regulator [Bacteroidota bacterium]